MHTRRIRRDTTIIIVVGLPFNQVVEARTFFYGVPLNYYVLCNRANDQLAA